jgi:hypothetical protein
MNISYNWLKDLIEVNLLPQESAQKLTNVGLERMCSLMFELHDIHLMLEKDMRFLEQFR